MDVQQPSPRPTSFEVRLKPFYYYSKLCMSSGLGIVYNIPVGFMSINVGKQIGDFVGKFLEYDMVNNNRLRRSFMRIKV